MRPTRRLALFTNRKGHLWRAKGMIWRASGEPVTELDRVKDCLEHAAIGAIRQSSLASVNRTILRRRISPGSGIIAAGIRACLNLILILLRIRKIPQYDLLHYSPGSYSLKFNLFSIQKGTILTRATCYFWDGHMAVWCHAW
jgi:hypothetical protein